MYWIGQQVCLGFGKTWMNFLAKQIVFSGHSYKSFTNINSFKLYNNLMKAGLFLPPFNRWGSWDTARRPHDWQVVEPRSQTQAAWALTCYCLLPPASLLLKEQGSWTWTNCHNQLSKARGRQYSQQAHILNQPSPTPKLLELHFSVHVCLYMYEWSRRIHTNCYQWSPLERGVEVKEVNFLLFVTYIFIEV